MHTLPKCWGGGGSCCHPLNNAVCLYILAILVIYNEENQWNIDILKWFELQYVKYIQLRNCYEFTLILTI